MTSSDSDMDLSETAAFWAVRLSGEPSQADLAAFDAWVAENPAHLSAFNDAEDALGLVSEHAHSPELLAMRSEALERTRRLQKQRWSGGMDRRHFFGAAAACLVAVPVGAVWWLSRDPAVETLTTDLGERRTVTLSDGTRVTLDARTEVRVAYTAKARKLELAQGRAYFEVAKDRKRPLTVVAGERSVTAIGTAFSVERDPGGLSVTLVEGKVRVADPQATQGIHMTPNQTLRLSDGRAPTLMQAVDTGRALAWREGQIVFDDVDLASAVARMNAYSRTPIVIEEGGRGAPLGSLRISGVFVAGDSMSFAEALKVYFNVQVSRTDNAITLRRVPAK